MFENLILGEELSVSQLAQRLKKTVEDQFSFVRVKGEISGAKYHSSGHLYFSLKDDQAVLLAVAWRGTVSKFPIKAEDGLEVIATGRITTYPGRSQYQIVVEQMEVAGVGALLKQLEERRKKLAAEGLFDVAKKKKLPFLPQKIGVITSPTGAVIKDILHRIEDRFPCHVMLWPVLVQGEGAADQVKRAIEGFNNMSPELQPDVIIVARGGGSLEDLWAFNEENVVRAAAASMIPLVSAVGHETDTTLIDYASDLRAPTPTAAAEMVVPQRSDLFEKINVHSQRLYSVMQRLLSFLKERLLQSARFLDNPLGILEMRQQKSDDWFERLNLSFKALLASREMRLNNLKVLNVDRFFELYRYRFLNVSARLLPNNIHQRINLSEQKLKGLSENFIKDVLYSFQQKQQMLQHSSQMLETLSYKKTLQRGFVLVRGSDGNAINATSQIKNAILLSLQFSDGVVKGVFEKDKDFSDSKEAVKKKPETSANSDQAQLF